MSYKVAVTTTDGISINQHFGQADSFLIIEVNEETGTWKEAGVRIVGKSVHANETSSEELCMGHFDPHIEKVAALLSDCIYLLTERIGRKPYKILQQNGINSLESPAGLIEAIRQLNQYLNKTKKILGNQTGGDSLV